MTGAWAGAGCGGRGLVAGLRVGLACGVLLLPGFGVSSSSPQVPGHPTSICDAGVNPDKTWVFDQSERVQGPIYVINNYRLFHFP